MIFSTRCVVLVCGFLFLSACGPESDDSQAIDPRLTASRAAAMQFSSELKERLTAAMSQQGPEAAVAVCAIEAPAIAQRVSREAGATVGRTALKFRNPDNAPSPWQAQVMMDFADRLEAGADPAELEFAVATADGGYRYMKVIGTAPQCLACHGEVQPGPLADAIAHYFPNDQATGFAAGDVRGAFVVEWSIAK